MRFVHGAEARERSQELQSPWPRFLTHDEVSNRYWNRLYDDYSEFQFVLMDGDRPVAEGNCVPVSGMPAQWRDAFLNAWEGGGEPDRVCALAIIVAPERQGTGLSAPMLAHMREVSVPLGLLVAPVRPTLKASYPLISVSEYATWRRDDGSHFDPWVRTHERAGGTILGTAEEAMLIEGSRDDWQGWTELEFPGDGEYVVPGALAPVRFDGGRGVYREPCIWVEHRSR
jgi:GNAT superfamily N-acetyltransferase